MKYQTAESVTLGHPDKAADFIADSILDACLKEDPESRVTIGNSVTSIGDYVFSYCTDLTTIKYTGTKARWNAIKKSNYWNDITGSYTIYCTDGTLSK